MNSDDILFYILRVSYLLLMNSNNQITYKNDDMKPSNKLTFDEKQQTDLLKKIQHDTFALTKHVFNKSYQKYPKGDNESWNEPYLDPSIFYIKGKHEVTFQKQIPTTILDELVTKVEEYICSANSVKTNPKRRGFYFY